MRPLWFVVLAACGRIGFDGSAAPEHDATLARDAAGDAGPPHGVADPALYVPFEPDRWLADVSGRAHELACEGACPVPVAGRVGDAGRFDATTCVTIGDRADLQPPAFSLAVWVRLRDAVGGSAFGRSYMSETDYLNSFEVYTDAMQWIVIVGSETYEHPLQLGAWAHLAATYDGMRYVVYVDGVERAVGMSSVPYSSGFVRIGCDRDFGETRGHLHGDVDEVLLYDRALTAAEVAAIAATE